MVCFFLACLTFIQSKLFQLDQLKFPEILIFIVCQNIERTFFLHSCKYEQNLMVLKLLDMSVCLISACS